ncbi:inner centromere protein A [Nasonia vitripennis]|uniref:Uncharacterized protein n=1 Tax=Nasonia vitripennis TaxID=7425 RepID=A0A7M7IYX2_NASVI|nr:inner centromere protein A [Nasonia vitripennis]XP_032454980.1 inner centromere protein A [Nasonia vitripennis]
MDKKTVIQMLQTDFVRIHKESEEISKTVQDMKQEALDYINALLGQITSTGTTSLLAKTPKVPKKRATRIKAIPENDEMEMSDDGNSLCNSTSTRSSRLNSLALETSEITSGRSKRGASIKAADIIKKQQAVSLNTKLRRPSNEGSDLPVVERIIKESRSKRPKDSNSSEDEDTRPAKQSKITRKKTQSKVNDETHNLTEDFLRLSKINETHINQENQIRASVKRKLDDHDEDANTTIKSEQSARKSSLTNDEPSAKKANYSKFSPEKLSASKDKTISIENIKSIKKNTRSSSSIDVKNSTKVNNIINETLDMSNVNETIASMYEDAINKPIPIMNSTMNPNTTVTLDKIINVTVSLERLPSTKVLNETVTINKISTKDPLLQVNNTTKKIIEDKVIEDKPTVPSIKAKHESKIPTILKAQRDEKIGKFNDLITDDESSPERKEYKVQKEKILKQQKRVTRSNASMTSDEDEVQRTPVRMNQNSKNKDLRGSTLKSTYKQAALFSPYAKDSVKKRVEAFEQVTVSPQQSETATRVTRTKTRALAAATEPPPLTVAQKLARKSLAKAKKISLAKHAKDNDDTKENENTNIVKPTKSSSSEKSAQKPSGKTTPLGKTRIQMPSSVTKNTYATPSNSQYLSAYSKPTTGSRGNIVTHVDSFIQSSSTSASKQIDRVAEEKRRRAHEEDARRKREELLKAQAEEKKRKREEKELKNKLAREAKERQEQEKRLKAEREREEKARLAQQMQEKQKEEMERKRIAQLQRAQEKEERRKQEELLRLQRLQEQEEQERLLAEQKRRELEMEKRKQMEMRQQMAEMKHQKNQMEKALLLAKAKAQKQAPCNYKMDSDPDEEESEDESKPKHQIPYWASKNARQPQLAMQQHVPWRTVLRFFDAKKCTPDLRDLFQGIDPRKLKRSSSAIWKTPPRYSMMNCSIIKD